MILSISSLILLSSCSTQKVVETRYIVNTPAKIDKPVAPKFYVLDSSKPISDKDNFKKLQVNVSLLKNYVLGLQEAIDYYEKEIDRINKEKDSKF